MRTRSNVGIVLTFLLSVVVTPPRVINAQQTAEPKVDTPRAGTHGVTSPQCIYCPAPANRKDGKGKMSGTVLLDVTVTADGRVAKPIVLKAPSDSRAEEALEAVREWKMKPASGPDGKPIACRVQVEVTFHPDSAT
jgi:TonB family protein